MFNPLFADPAIIMSPNSLCIKVIDPIKHAMHWCQYELVVVQLPPKTKFRYLSLSPNSLQRHCTPYSDAKHVSDDYGLISLTRQKSKHSCIPSFIISKGN